MSTANPSRRPASRAGFLVGAVITLFWGVMMFTLVKDRILPQRREAVLSERSVAPAALTADWHDQAEFMAVKLAGKEIGAAAATVTKVMEGQIPTYEAEFRMGIELSLVGIVRPISVRARGELDGEFALSRFHFSADLAGYKLSATGRASQDELLVQVDQGGGVNRARFQLDRRITLLEAVRPVATSRFKIKPGNTFAVPVVDPVWSMDHGTLVLTVKAPETIEVDGAKVTAFPVESRLNDQTSMSWVDAEGRTLKREVAGGLMLERTTEEKAIRLSPDISKPVEMPRLDLAGFKDVQPRKLGPMAKGGKSPLDTLSKLFK